MRIDKARNDEVRTVIDDFGLRMGLAERHARSNFSNFTFPQQNSSISPVPGHVWPGRLERVACETKGLSEEKCVGHEKLSKILLPGFILSYEMRLRKGKYDNSL